jgi:hypothetical protein
MSSSSTGSTRSTESRVRIGDAERDAAAAALGNHFASGRLTREEFDERLEQAWAARTAVDLDPLFADLPGPADHRPPARTDRRPRQIGAPGWRPRFRFPPVIVLVLAAVLLLHGFTAPFVVFGLAILWFSGVVGRCRPNSRRPWAPSP